MLKILSREFVYLRYYFELQLMQIFRYWVLGIAIGSFISVFASRITIAAIKARVTM